VSEPPTRVDERCPCCGIEWQHHAGAIRLCEQAATLKTGILAVADLIDESRGVLGLHLNGDPASWSDLRTGGRFEEWLREFDEALELSRQIHSNEAKRTQESSAPHENQ